MAVAGDDTMDFNFETGAKGKTTAFNFSKMDMDFNLDGDFGKISSFKVDMSDLDFSPKKTGKSKERSGEDSVNRNHQGKQDNFAFSFDFNDLDTFNFEPSLTKAEKKSSKGVSADKSVCQDSRNPLAEDISAFDDGIAMKLPACEMATTLKADTLVGGLGNLDSINDNGSSETANFENQSLSNEARTSMEKKVMITAEESDKQSQPSAKAISADPYDHRRIQDIPVESVSKNETHGTVSELQTKFFSLDPKVNNISGGEQNVNTKMIAESRSNHECSQFDNSPPLHITTSQSNDTERNKMGCGDHVPAENIDGTQPEKCDLDLEDILLRKALHVTKADSENKNSTSELTLTPLSSGHMMDKLIPLKEKATGAIRSKYFRRTEETSQLHQALSTQTKVLSLGSKRIDGVHLIPADEEREDTTIGGKLVGRSSSQTTELAKGEPVFLGSEKNVQDVNPIKDDLDAVRTQSRISKLVSTSRPCVQEVAKGETVLLGSARSVKDLNTFSLQVDPSSSIKQIAKSSTHKCVNPKPVVLSMGPIKNLKTISVEGNKLSGVKDLSRTPKPSSLKISRATGASNILSNSTFGKEIKSLRKSEQNMELQGKTASKMVPSVDTLKKTPPTSSSSLKRKTLEASNANVTTLNPLKRLSESPREIRNFKEASEVVFKEQVCNQEKLVDMNTKNVLTSVLDTPREVNMSELEIPLAMENDLNVEKAEAYTKDLEDICNMLKKKHEEAKEILVRAIVNNNNLLMVNHPVYEEKIRTIQKFAARIMSKELQV
ncbi:hypothetical protein VitviT2T_015174 [Vitis vinifera]|uniref:Uncharacterized protein n=2 Tax=Vitis vinifera TaxID=29760 RepID=A0ABY9CPT6_VITVI|nr:uncharacterized protein At4g18490 isoform X2 [Vitis vinifera]XP_019078004.1 uncharacterized protein At4g18490 isoform X2 [Vitis vinifera]WJZ96491.1 hypothetical protein VitviT2T_015174 [Vitis vinifera]|eukprot:XP_019078003.1 PREDICTED: uncharacterized protein At4g18490 isoform X3 [Vitis vinifera]